jgi:hypothetical protein
MHIIIGGRKSENLRGDQSIDDSSIENAMMIVDLPMGGRNPCRQSSMRLVQGRVRMMISHDDVACQQGS